MREAIKKILLETIYTPDAKPRFVGGNINNKMQYIDEAVDKIVNLEKDVQRISNAGNYLCDNSYMDDELNLEQQVEAIQKQAEIDGSVMIDNVEGVVVWEKVENTFNCDEFLDLIE